MATGLSSPKTAETGWNTRLWALLFVLSGNMLIDALEVSAVLVTLPGISDDLGLSLWRVQWVMSGFALGFGALLLLGPRVTARWGRRRVYLAAMLVFGIASLVGGIVEGGTLLVATRIVKGTCAALTAPTGLAIINDAFPAGPQQRRAVSVYSLFGAAGFTAGLLVGGSLAMLDWRWVLVFPAPVALLLLLFAVRLVPADTPGSPAPPVFRPALLANGAWLRSALGAAVLNGTYLGLLLLTTFSMQDGRGWSPWQTALAFLPACLPLAVSAPFAGRLVERFGAGRLIALGSLAPAAGYAYRLAPFGPDSYVAGVLPTLLLVGAGFVLSFGALNMRATSGVAPEERGTAIALYQSAVQFSAVLMLSLVAALLTGFDSDRPALLLITSVGVAGVLVACTGPRSARGNATGKESTR